MSMTELKENIPTAFAGYFAGECNFNFNEPKYTPDVYKIMQLIKAEAKFRMPTTCAEVDHLMLLAEVYERGCISCSPATLRSIGNQKIPHAEREARYAKLRVEFNRAFRMSEQELYGVLRALPHKLVDNIREPEAAAAFFDILRSYMALVLESDMVTEATDDDQVSRNMVGY